MKKQDPAEIRTILFITFLAQAVIYSVLWLWNEFVASYLTLIFPGMILAILIIATIAELIEPSRIPKWYYSLMIISIVTPLVIGMLFYYLYGGRMDWLAG